MALWVTLFLLAGVVFALSAGFSIRVLPGLAAIKCLCSAGFICAAAYVVYTGAA